jgi:hypothetical protein
MLKTFDNKIRGLSSLRNVLLLVFIHVAASVVIFNFGFIPAISQLSQDFDILDNTFNYTPEHVYRVFSIYGEEGRGLYLSYLLLLDFIYPILFAFTNSILLAYLFERLIPRVRYLYLTPFIALLFDYLENIGILTLLLNYPTQLFVIAGITSAITVLKLILVNILFIITLIALAGVLIKALYHRLRKQK